MSPYPAFVALSRRPALKTKGSTLDPTLRDDMANGMESSRAKFTRSRREWSVTIEYLSSDDAVALQNFVEKVAVFGANIFLYLDDRDKHRPQWLTVRFSKLPTDTDAGWIVDSFRKSITFEIREV